MIDSKSVTSAMFDAGFNFFSGVPCSFLAPIITRILEKYPKCYVAAAQEGEAAGLAIGAYLAGKNSVVLCQNSGLGNTVNAMTSLAAPFEIPLLILTSWRGEAGLADEPQHTMMGEITPSLLDLLKIPWAHLPSNPATLAADFSATQRKMAKGGRSFAYIVRKGDIAPDELLVPCNRNRSVKMSHEPTNNRGFNPPKKNNLMSRTAALEAILGKAPASTAIFATTGKTSRELYAIADRPSNFYVIGAMGHASAIGAGTALGLPQQPVIIIDGDGAALMKLGNLTTIGRYQPSNLLHIVLDNNVHDSTGGQRTASHTTNFLAIAAAVGYQNTAAAHCPDSVNDAVALLSTSPGPNLLYVTIASGSPRELGRPNLSPIELKDRFMSFLQENN